MDFGKYENSARNMGSIFIYYVMKCRNYIEYVCFISDTKFKNKRSQQIFSRIIMRSFQYSQFGSNLVDLLVFLVIQHDKYLEMCA